MDGGDIDLDFVAAGPFTYDHSTGLGSNPPFGFNNRTIDDNTGVVESLESGDFQCDDLVTFFTEITIDPTNGGPGTIELDYSFGAETTGQPGLGFTDIIGVAVNTPDGGNANLDGDEVATLVDESFDSTGYQRVLGTVEVAGIDAGDAIIVRLIVKLGCIQGSNPTGNILNAIEDGRVTSPAADDISVGQQTVPMKSSGFVAAPSIFMFKDCPAAASFGDDITYDITITNDGNEDLDTVVVTDSVDGRTAVVVAAFPSTLDAGDSFTGQFTYTPDGTESDPLPNTATVTAQGVESETQVTDTNGCETDITHAPGIVVTKSCPPLVAFGADISYTITVTNTGTEALEGVTVNDTLLGDITADFAFSGSFPVGGVATAIVTYLPGADEDPVSNTVTATGTGVDSESSATGSAVCTTDVSNPGISILKTVDEEIVPIGTTVTFTYVITNTGDVTLYDISVDDDILGHIGDIASLDPGDDATLTKDFVVGDEIVTNVGTAVGHDILGRSVSASDDATVAPIAGANPPPPNNPPTTPFTGSDAGRLGLITIVLFGIGVTVVASTRRRRPKGEAA